MPRATKTKNAPKVRAATPSGTSEVDAFLAGLAHPRKKEIEALRAAILAADRRIRESIKWNAPSFMLDDHFATFKLHPPGSVQIVLHTGAKTKPNARPIQLDDPTGLLRWAAPNRGIVVFSTAPDARARKAFVALVKQWIAQL